MGGGETGRDTSGSGRATVARIYDYFLGGTYNFPADREAGDRIIHAVPETPIIARANRMFLRRAVRKLATLGFRQFLDMGSGIPTEGNVHEIAEQVDPRSRVLYIDIDPVAVMVSNEMLVGNPYCRAIVGDLTRPDELLEALRQPDLAEIIDLTQPTALLYFSVLQSVPDDQLHRAVEPIRNELPASSALAISHIGPTIIDTAGADPVNNGIGVYRTHAATHITLRSAEQLLPLFDGFTLMEPGLTRSSDWHPDANNEDPYHEQPERSPMLCGIGLRRH
ncbi:SAM-dependent methyltransferase [Salinispora arenicola]|uniref:SAM-dependent methyltransferase n=1 Tax=Salinispora arenicola TaxID=168697 RepID=UPI00037C6D44|nr:SAM-dependent methyltransferase [Salinispora arenicola]